jgi:putative spermidine/putrescine transport system permease protein
VIRALLWTFSLLVLFFLLAPLVVVGPVSLTRGYVARFPPEGLSLKWYREFMSDEYWLGAVWLSLRLGVAVALTTTVIGLCTAVALTRFVPNLLLKRLVRLLVLAPLIVPLIVSAVALFDILSRLRLVESFLGLVLAHTVLAMPFSVIVIENGLAHFDLSLEEAARTLGASRLGAFRKVTLPLIAPTVAGAGLFAFVTSWDEVVVVLLVGGTSQQTLPVKMFLFMETELRPTVAAVSTLLIVGLVLALLLMQLFNLRRVWRERRALEAEASELRKPLEEHLGA